METKPKNTFTIVHQTGNVYMAPYMVFTLLKYNVLTKLDENTYKVEDEQHYWKVLQSLT